jgi:hypothetical protein
MAQPNDGRFNIDNTANQVERLAFFGWLWESHHAINVFTPTKNDKAGIDKR